MKLHKRKRNCSATKTVRPFSPLLHLIATHSHKINKLMNQVDTVHFRMLL